MSVVVAVRYISCPLLVCQLAVGSENLWCEDSCTTYYVKRSGREKASQVEVIDPFDPTGPFGFAQGKTFTQGRTEIARDFAVMAARQLFRIVLALFFLSLARA